MEIRNLIILIIGFCIAWLVIATLSLYMLFVEDPPRTRKQWWKRLLGSVFWPFVVAGVIAVLIYYCVSELCIAIAKLCKSIVQIPAK